MDVRDAAREVLVARLVRVPAPVGLCLAVLRLVVVLGVCAPEEVVAMDFSYSELASIWKSSNVCLYRKG